MVTICIPTLNRYDLLNKLIKSAENGLIVPDEYLIVDNGNGLGSDFNKVKIYKPGRNLGVAASWNWLIRNSKDIRIICNDDIEFHTDTIESFIRHYDETKIMYPAFIAEGQIYSCFSISDYVVNIVGYFDETISPNYGYYEDNDYDFRLKELRDNQGKNVDYKAIPCGYNHDKSSTLRKYNAQEMEEHHIKFKLARNNFIKKWGRLPE